jgi:hypothetical protein
MEEKMVNSRTIGGKMRKILFLAMMMIACTMFFSACGDDDGGGSPTGPGGGAGSTEYLDFRLETNATDGEYYIVSGNSWKIQEDNITSITIPATYQGKPVKAINAWAFGSLIESGDLTLTNLRSVTIPSSILYIGNYAFQYCSGLTSITLPNVKYIGNNAFAYCSSLSSVSLGNSLTGIGDNAFSKTRLTSISIPNSTTYIGERAFYNCTSLTSATIGNSVANIYEYAFYGCTSLVRVTFNKADTNIQNGSYVFPGDLRTKYIAGGIGTYTRPSGGNTWTKQ